LRMHDEHHIETLFIDSLEFVRPYFEYLSMASYATLILERREVVETEECPVIQYPLER